MRIHLLFAAAFLAGCVAVPVADLPSPEAEPSQESVSIPWSLEGCRALIADVRFDPREAQGILPPGFDFLTGPLLDLPFRPEALERAYLGVKAYDCERGSTLDGMTAPLTFGSFFIDVAPPEALRQENAAHFLAPLVVIPDPERRAWLQEAGVVAVDGTVRVTDEPGGRSAVLDLEGIGRLTFSALSTRQYGSMEGARFREFSPAGEGFVFWDALADIADASAGRGVLEAPASSLPARLGGGTTIQVEVWAGTVTIREGTISKLPT